MWVDTTNVSSASMAYQNLVAKIWHDGCRVAAGWWMDGSTAFVHCQVNVIEDAL